MYKLYFRISKPFTCLTCISNNTITKMGVVEETLAEAEIVDFMSEQVGYLTIFTFMKQWTLTCKQRMCGTHSNWWSSHPVLRTSVISQWRWWTGLCKNPVKTGTLGQCDPCRWVQRTMLTLFVRMVCSPENKHNYDRFKFKINKRNNFIFSLKKKKDNLFSVIFAKVQRERTHFTSSINLDFSLFSDGHRLCHLLRCCLWQLQRVD